MKASCIYISFTTKSERIKLIEITASRIISLFTQEKPNQFIYRRLINVMATFEEFVKKIQIKFKILDLAV